MIIGNLGNDPDMRYMPSGDAVANFSVATTEKWKDKQTGEQKEQTEWHRVNVFGRLAEICGEYLHKGSKVYIEGSVHTRSYEKDGIKRYSTEVKGRTMKMLDSRSDNQQSGGSSNPNPTNGSKEGEYGQQQPQQGPGPDDFDDDIPF